MDISNFSDFESKEIFNKIRNFSRLFKCHQALQIVLSATNNTIIRKNEPKMMVKCAHTICSSCVEIILKQDRRCPLDRTKFNESYTNINQFAKNIALLNLIEDRKYSFCVKTW